MKIIFLGTGPDKPIPRPGHRDAVCQDARRGTKSRRTRSAALVVDSGRNILIDAGPDIADQLAREKIHDVDAVFLTHAHADAAGGIKILDAYLSRRSDHDHIPVFTDKITVRKLSDRFRGLKCLWLFPIEDFLPVAIGTISVHPFPVAHSLQPGFPTRGYLIKRGENTSVAYASDVSRLPWTTKKFLGGIPLLILDGAMYLKKKMPAHLSAEQAVAIAEGLKAGKLILTQIGHSYPPHRIAEKEIKKYLRDSETEFPKTVRLAFDGLKINL